jgi:hypothetical protein
MFPSLITITMQKKQVDDTQFQCPHVAFSKRFGNATKQAAIREHALRSYFNVEIPSHPQFNL